ncbi:ADP-heptose:LPS heptosyltransferase [Oxalobacteraceae bacterium GrIS 1.11]
MVTIQLFCAKTTMFLRGQAGTIVYYIKIYNSKASMSIAFNHLLICRTDNIGDVVLTLPLAGFLKSRYPDLKIDFLCRAYAAPLVRQCSFIDRVIEVETLEQPQAYFATSGIDAIIFAFPNRRLAQAAKRAGIRYRVGTSHRLFHWLTCNKLAHFSRARSALHEAQLNFSLLRPLGIRFTPPLAEVPALYGLSAPQRPEVDALFASHAFNLILHPKSNGNGREWPLHHYVELARLLQSDPGIRVWITGSAAEGAWLAEHGAALLQAPNVSNICGKFDLNGLSALIGAADGLIASGTGPLHLASALGRPALGLFPTLKPIDPARWGALGARAQSLTAESDCTPCSGAQSCDCMEAIAPARVAAVVRQWQSVAA